MGDQQMPQPYMPGSLESVGLLTTGKKKAAPRLLSAMEEMQYAHLPGGGKLGELAQQRFGAMQPQEPAPGSPEFFKRRNQNAGLGSQKA